MVANKTELIKELRSLTQAGMANCKSALEESDWDLQKAVDLVKAKGLQNTTRQESKIAAEGVVRISNQTSFAVMVEVNCQTDFVAKSPAFSTFVDDVLTGVVQFMDVPQYPEFNLDKVEVNGKTLEQARKELMASTGENIVVRRWWVEQIAEATSHIATYTHGNSKVGVMVSFGTEVPNDEGNLKCGKDVPGLKEFADNVAMQIAAMSPIAVNKTQLLNDVVNRQQAIFETQLREAKKPEAAWAKILDGKFNKWYSDVCLLNQESVLVQKKTIEDLLNDLQKQVGGTIKIFNFQRCAVGEGIEVVKEDLASEVEKLSGVQQNNQGSEGTDDVVKGVTYY